MSWLRRRKLLLLLSLWLRLGVPTPTASSSSSSPGRWRIRTLRLLSVVVASAWTVPSAFGYCYYYNYDCCCCHGRRLHSSSSFFFVGRQRRVRRSVGHFVDIDNAVVVHPPVGRRRRRRRRRRTTFLQMGKAGGGQDDVEGSVQALARVDNLKAEHVPEQERGVGVGLYVHLPFCRRRCRYCSFAVVPVGEEGQQDGGGRDRLMERYMETLVHEIRGREDHVEDSTRRRRRITSVYIGGGTPSLVPIPLLQQVLNAVHDVFEVMPGAEITMEMDPGTFDSSYLQDAIELLGVNRVSLGIQSLNGTILQHLGRQHTVQDAHRAIELVRNVTASPQQQQHDSSDGLLYSIDLISSVPGLSIAEWCHTLQTAVDQWNPPHISIYDLQIERGTVFGSWYGSNIDDNINTNRGQVGSSLSLPTDDESAYMYRYASAYLTARGYEHYEVSSYANKRNREAAMSESSPTSRAKTDPTSADAVAAAAIDADPSLPYSYRSRHNQVYWDPDGSWYGFGMGATSYLNGRTVARPKTLHDYIKWVDQRGGTAAVEDDYASMLDEHATGTVTANSALDLCESIVLKRLRTVDGLDLERDVAQRFGQDHVDAILHGAMLGMELGLAELDPITRVLRLTAPDGFLLSNSVLSSIFVALEDLYER